MMLAKEAFLKRCKNGAHLLDCATGTTLMKAGMQRGCCMAEWVLLHPEVLVALQKACAEAGSEIIYAPTFQAQPVALAAYGLEHQTETINEMLAALSRKAAPECLIAGNMTTLRGFMDTANEANLEQQIGEYRRQIRALVNGGADLLAAETLLHPLEAKAVLQAAALENATTVMISFAARADGTLYSGHELTKILPELEAEGAAAVGVNCIAASDELSALIRKLRLSTQLPLICKPNAGRPANDAYPVDESMFIRIMKDCIREGANLVGGCCGTTPKYLAALKNSIA